MQPCLRADIDPVSVEVDGQQLIALRDPDAYRTETALVQPGTLHVLEYFDGTHTLEEIRVDLARRGAGFIGLDELDGLVESLDRCLLLDNERYRGECEAREQSFLDEPARPAAHAGAAYPEDRDEAREFLQEMLDAVGPAPAAPLTRLIAPHIDLALGADVHASAHQRLKASGRPDVAVVLGVCHASCRQRFVLCRKDFETPLGTVPNDARLADALEKRLDGVDLTQGQLVHRAEHSVEFQALWLAHLWPDDPPAIVPILVGSFHDFVENRVSPSIDPEIEQFVEALRGAIDADGRNIVVIASVDLAHLGPQYGQPVGLDEAGEREMEVADLALLEQASAGKAERFFDGVARDGNARNVCGLAPVYLTLRLGDGEGDLVRYGQGRIHPESGSVVSYAAVAFAQ